MLKTSALGLPAFAAIQPFAMRRLSLLTLALLAFTSCVDGDAPLTPMTGTGDFRLAISADMSLLDGSVYAGLPINRIRLTATTVGGDTLAVQLFTVSDQPSWTIPFEVPASDVPIIVVIELINLTDGVETVEFSAVTPPITLNAAGESSVTAPTPTPGPPGNLTVTSLSIVDPPASVTEGDAVQLQAVIVGGTASARPIWRSLDVAVATVNETGLVTLLRNGSVRIVAQAGNAVDTVTINAAQRPTAIRVTPESATAFSLGVNMTYTAVVSDARGAPIPGLTINWTIDNAAIAAPQGGGIFRSNSNGSTRVHATLANSNPALTASAALTVTQAPATLSVTPGSYIFTAVGLSQTFTATALDANNNPVLASFDITWSSSAAAVVSVNNAGVATAVGGGDAVITASSGTATGTANVSVRQTVATLDVVPATANLAAVGASTTLTVTARDANSNPIASPAGITWSSADPTIATVDAAGVVTAVRNGTVRITAAAGAVSDFADVTVRQIVTSITIAPAAAELSGIGGTAQLVATGRDANNHVAPAAVFTWSSSAPGIATVNAAGLVTGTGYGDATITAAADGASGNATARVLRPGITISPEIMMLNAINASQLAVASIRDAAGNPVPGAVAEWTTVNSAVATVSATGEVLATGPGTTLLIASFAGNADTITVTVSQTPASITVEPAAVNAPANTDVQLVATARDANGFAIPDATIEYESSAPSIATVNAAGLIHTVSLGSATITVRSNGVSTTVPVSVSTPGDLPDLRVASITITPAGDLHVGEPANVQFFVASDFAASGPSTAVVVVYDAEDDTPILTVPISIPAIGAGSQHTSNIPFTPQASWPEFVYARVTLDAMDAVNESNEDNNVELYPGCGLIHVVHPDLGDPGVEIEPGFVIMDGGGELVELAVTVRDDNGNVIPADVTWTSSNTYVATVDTAGRVVSYDDGFTQIIASVYINDVLYSDTIVVQVGELEAPDGVTITWIGSRNPEGSNDWNIPANWRENRVPNASDVVFIPDCFLYYDGLEGTSRCSYPELSSNVTVTGLATGFDFDYYAENRAALPQLVAVTDAAATPAQKAVARQLRHEAVLDRAQSIRDRALQSPRSAPVHGMVNSMAASAHAEFAPHLHISHYDLVITGDVVDYIFVNASEGVVRLTGEDAIFNGSVNGDLEVTGTITTYYTSVFSDLVIEADASLTVVNQDFNADGFVDVQSDLTIREGGLLQFDDDASVYVEDDLTVDGGLVQLEDNGYLLVDDQLVLENNAQLDIGYGYVYIGSDDDCEDFLPGDLITESGATIIMQDYYSYLTVDGDVEINGGSTTGLLTRGQIYIYGDFTVGGPSNQAFAAEPDLSVSFGGGESQHDITIAQPGFGAAGNHFGTLYSNSASLIFHQPTFIEGNFYGSVGSPGTELEFAL